MSNDPDWTLARSFLAVMRGGSLSAAARHLGTAQATIRRHVETLEAALGTPLFVRTPTGLSPTGAAHAALPHAVALEAGVAALSRAARGGDGVAGTVRVTCSEVIGVEVLPPILAGLLTQHPALEIELVPTNTVQDILRRDADIAVRMTRPTQAAIVARRIGAVAVGLYARSDYLVGRASIRNVKDLGAHRLIGGDCDDRLGAELVSAGVAAPQFVIRSDSDLAQLAALRAGAGIGVCQVPIAARDPALTPVLPDFRLWLDLWLAMHEDLRAVGRVRATFNALADGLAAYLAGGADGAGVAE